MAASSVPITPGSGKNIATELISGKDYQLVKIVSGTLEATDAISGEATNGLDVDVTRLPALVAGSANIGDVDVLTLPALVAGTALIGKVGIDQTTPGTTNAVALQPATFGGCLPHQIVTAGSTNAANIKSSPGQVFGVHFLDIADYAIFVKLHNTAGVPTAGAGVVVTIGIQAGQRCDEVFPGGLMFSAGIGVTVTKFMPLIDITPVLAEDGVGHIDWK